MVKMWIKSGIIKIFFKVYKIVDLNIKIKIFLSNIK
jgi:hypothetical protein